MSNVSENLEGLVFAMPLSDNRFSFGQVVRKQHPIYYMAGLGISKDSCDVSDEEVRFAEIVALGNFFDVLIKKGRWIPLQKIRPLSVPFPCFKLKVGDGFVVEDWERTKSRPANGHDLEKLGFRANHGPIILENAVKHFFGHHQKEDVFKWLSPEYIDDVSDLV